MNGNPIYIVDFFEDIVNDISTEMLTDLQAIDSNITGVHYDYGHPLEIIKTLAQKDKSDSYVFKKYPLVALFQDFKETTSTADGIQGLIEVELHLIIASGTKPDYKAKERYTHNFKPILNPIYLKLLQGIYKSGKFLVYNSDRVVHNKFDRLYWGNAGLYGNRKNIFNDFLDVIEIRNLRLKTYKNIC